MNATLLLRACRERPAPPTQRHRLNRACFAEGHVDEGGTASADLAEPLGDLPVVAEGLR